MKNAFGPAAALHGSVALPFVIPSAAEGSAVPRTFHGNVFRRSVAQWICGSHLLANNAKAVSYTHLVAAPSRNAIIGRYILTPRIFDVLEKTPLGAGGELQLTDGIKGLLAHEKVYGYSFDGLRFDAGDKFGMLKATVEFALNLSLIHI